MKRKQTLADFDKLTRKLGRLLVAEIDQKLAEERQNGKFKETTWVSVYLENRWPQAGNGCISKMRIYLSEDGILRVFLTSEILKLIDKIWAIQVDVFPNRWYGFKLTVTPPKNCQVDLNYDPDCYVDPNWYTT
jgi:hypothetical protein